MNTNGADRTRRSVEVEPIHYPNTGRVTRLASGRKKRGVPVTETTPSGSILNDTINSMDMRAVQSLCRSWNATSSEWISSVCDVRNIIKKILYQEVFIFGVLDPNSVLLDHKHYAGITSVI